MSRAGLTAVAALATVTATALGQATPAFAARATTLHVSPDGHGTSCSVAHPCSIGQAKAKVRTPQLSEDEREMVADWIDTILQRRKGRSGHDSGPGTPSDPLSDDSP